MNIHKVGFPAILGGDAAVTMKQEQANRWPVITIEDELAVLKIFRDGNISTHPVIRELEGDYRAFTRSSICFSMPSMPALFSSRFLAGCGRHGGWLILYGYY